jgi:phosphatidylglycerophosphate synthase
MQRFKRDFDSIYSDSEERVLGFGQKVRQMVLAPLAMLLSRLGITPDMLSFFSVILAIGFCLLAPVYFTLAFWLLCAALVCDALDGVEARATGKSTPRGSFTDLVCDQAVVAFSVAGLAWKGSLHPVLAILFIYVYIALGAFVMLHILLQVSSRWIIRPSRLLLYVAVALEFFFHVEILNYLLSLYLLALPLVTLSFWRIRNAL